MASDPGRSAREVQRLVRRLVRSCWLLRLGILLFVAGALGDVAYHTLEHMSAQAMPVAVHAGTPVLDRLLGPDGRLAHLVTFAGMGLTLLGILVN